MDFFTLFLIIFILISVVVLYMYSMQKKGESLDYFEEKICPKCKSGNVSSKKLSSSCCGVNEYLFECHTCGYKDSFSVGSSHSSCINNLKGDEVYSGVDEKSIKV